MQAGSHVFQQSSYFFALIDHFYIQTTIWFILSRFRRIEFSHLAVKQLTLSINSGR